MAAPGHLSSHSVSAFCIEQCVRLTYQAIDFMDVLWYLLKLVFIEHFVTFSPFFGLLAQF